MKKCTYFDYLPREGWPSPNEMERYFLSALGRRQAFDTDNDGTEHLPAGTERIDIRLTIVGNLRYGAFLHYARYGGTQSDNYFSKADLKRLREWVETKHGDLRPVGLFIPFERAWTAVKDSSKAMARFRRASRGCRVAISRPARFRIQEQSHRSASESLRA
jgi:hypothetical protein